jgi:hypothetical protein
MKQTEKIINRNLKASLLNRKYPKCFESSRQYKEWLEQEDLAHTVPVRRNICEDCNLAYKNQMVIEGRCTNIQIVLKS